MLYSRDLNITNTEIKYALDGNYILWFHLYLERGFLLILRKFWSLKCIKSHEHQRETGAVRQQPMKSRSGIDFATTSVIKASTKIMGVLM